MARLATAERVSRDASDNFVFQRSLLAYDRAAALVSGDVLEIGTGTGYGIERIAPHCRRFVTVDKSAAAPIPATTGIEFRRMCVPPLDFADASFDFVITFQVIEHIADDAAFVREIARVLRPGGRMVYVVPGAEHLYQMRAVLYDPPCKNPVQEVAYEGFRPIGEREVSGSITVPAGQLEALFAMTPYYWKTPRDGAARLAALPELTTDIAFRFLVFEKE